MPPSTPSQSLVPVRCFCGNLIAMSRNARKAVICDQCRQPLPMKAIKLAIKDREAEDLERSTVLKPEVSAVV